MLTKRDNYSLGCAGMAVAGTPALSAYKITNILAYLIAGLTYIKAATDNIAWTLLTGQSAFVALAASQQSVFFFWLDSAGNARVTQGPVVASANASTYRAGFFEWPSDLAGYACIGAAKVACNASGAFTPGTTALNAANMTVTYYNAGPDYGVGIPY